MSIYQTSFNDDQLINKISTEKPQNRMIKYRDTFTFEKKSFLNNSVLPASKSPQPPQHENNESTKYASNNQYSQSVPLASSRIYSKSVNQFKTNALNSQQQDSSTAYNQHFNYVGAEPHISERIPSYTGAFGPKQEEIAYKFGSKNEANESKPAVSYSYNSQDSFNSNSMSSFQINDEAVQKSMNNNYMYSGIEDRPRVRSYDFRPVWIPKKYPGRNMFYSHLDSSIFPGKYDVT